MTLPDGLHSDFALDWSDPETLASAETRQRRICSAPSVVALAYPGCFIGAPHVAHVYLVDPEGSEAWAGVVWRQDRLPTTGEIAAALSAWRGTGAPTFVVRWWAEPPKP